MAWGYGPSVVHHSGVDYWRTWFLDECESSQLFGLTRGHLPLVTKVGVGVVPYHVGTKLYLEDAPCFPRSGKRRHRVCGPYEVRALENLPMGAVPVYVSRGEVIVYLESRPERGPWLNRSRVRRVVDGDVVEFRQMAGKFEYFPYRFKIARCGNWKAEIVDHVAGCWLC